MKLKASSIARTFSALLFAGMASAQILSLCNTGQTQVTASGCTGVLVTPNPTGGGPNRDGNWRIVYAYASPSLPTLDPYGLGFVPAWVDTPLLQAPFDSWLPNSDSTASEWITPYDGEGDQPQGWFIYKTGFRVPSTLSNGVVPSGLIINGRLASDNDTYRFALASLAGGGLVAFVKSLPIPINPSDSFTQWTSFSFTSPIALTPGSDVFLYVLVYNNPSTGSPNATGLRVEFFDTSAFY